MAASFPSGVSVVARNDKGPDHLAGPFRPSRGFYFLPLAAAFLAGAAFALDFAAGFAAGLLALLAAAFLAAGFFAAGILLCSSISLPQGAG